MYIGKLAQRSGATKKAILHYEKLGLLPLPQRQGRYRLYNPAHIEALRLIKCAQALGFGLKELAGVLADAHGKPPVDAMIEAIANKRALLRTQIDALIAREQALAALQADLRQQPELNCSAGTP